MLFNYYFDVRCLYALSSKGNNIGSGIRSNTVTCNIDDKRNKSDMVARLESNLSRSKSYIVKTSKSESVIGLNTVVVNTSKSLQSDYYEPLDYVSLAMYALFFSNARMNF